VTDTFCVCVVTAREHYQWNMDIWGISGVEAEAELLSAVVATFRSMGFTSKDVGIKVCINYNCNEVVFRPIPFNICRSIAGKF